MTLNQLQALEKGNEILKKALREELKAQGHYLTGALERSIGNKIFTDGKVVSLTGTMLYYAGIVDGGTPAGNIPYRAGSGAKTSKYIDALKAFFEKKGLSAKEAERAAFATAKKQKEEGMSTAASARFSKTGQRQGFVEAVEKRAGPKVEQAIDKGMDDMVDTYFKKTKSETI